MNIPNICVQFCSASLLVLLKPTHLDRIRVYNLFYLYYRNRVCLLFMLLNVLFVTIVFTLQQMNDTENGRMSISLPCATEGYGEAIEPISITFTLVFGILLVNIKFLFNEVVRYTFEDI